MKKLLIGIVVVILLFSLVMCGGDSGSGRTAYGLGDTFEFNGSSGLIELTFGTDITFTTVENSYSEYHGQDVISIPVTMTNLGEDTARFNSFDTIEFGTNGTSLGLVDMLVEGDDIRSGHELRPEATVTSNYHLLYDGDGEYVIEFDGRSSSFDLVFTIEK